MFFQKQNLSDNYIHCNCFIRALKYAFFFTRAARDLDTEAWDEDSHDVKLVSHSS